MLTNYSDIQEERDGLRYVEVPQDHGRVIVAVPHGPDRGWSLLSNHVPGLPPPRLLPVGLVETE